MLIPIVFATDSNYFPQTGVAIFSILKNSSKDKKFKIYILHSGDLKTKDKKKLEELLHGFNNVEVMYYDCSHEFEEAHSVIPHISKPTFYRLNIPNYLKEDVVIYLDSDVIVNKDISELFNFELGNSLLAGVLAPSWQQENTAMEHVKKKLGISNLKTYINAGVLLINNKLMRQENTAEAFTSLLPVKFACNDQDILNKVCFGRIKLLPYKFNYFGSHHADDSPIILKAFKKSEIDEASEDPVIYHFADKNKPWNTFNNKKHEIWWKYSKQTPWYHYFLLNRIKSSLQRLWG